MLVVAVEALRQAGRPDQQQAVAVLETVVMEQTALVVAVVANRGLWGLAVQAVQA
jgi:hypothetical protein